MLEFTEVFQYDQHITKSDIPTIMKCKNIDFGHVNWFGGLFSAKPTTDYNFMEHLANNIIDINVHDNNTTDFHTFMTGVADMGNPKLLIYMINNRWLSNRDFCVTPGYKCYIENRPKLQQSKKLVNYLTNVSLGKFEGYRNTEKYYNMIHTMLLIMKVQKKVPTSIVKHLITPFIYQ